MFSISYDETGDFVLSNVTDFELSSLNRLEGARALDSVREFIAACSITTKEDYLSWRRTYKQINKILTNASKKFKKLRKVDAATSSETFKTFYRAYQRKYSGTSVSHDGILNAFDSQRAEVHMFIAVALHELYNARVLYKYASCEAYRRARMKDGKTTRRYAVGDTGKSKLFNLIEQITPDNTHSTVKFI